MAYPMPIQTCEKCGCRFVIDPGAFVEEEDLPEEDKEALAQVQIICATCREQDYSTL